MRQLDRRRLYGWLITAVAMLIALAYEWLGPGFVRTEYAPTPQDLLDQGAVIGKAVRIAVLPALFLALLSIAGLFLALSPRHKKMDSFAKRIAVALVALFTVLGGVTCLFRPHPLLPISISYAGLANSPSGTRLALFTVTNHGKGQIDRARGYWIEKRPAPGRLNTAPAQSQQPIDLPSSRLLKAGESEVLAVPLPTASGQWRLVLGCGPYDLRRKLNRQLAANGGAVFPAGSPRAAWRFPVGYELCRSGWVSE